MNDSQIFWVVYMNAGNVRYVLTWFDTEEEAQKYCEENHWQYIDENRFEWSLDYDEETTTVDDLVSREKPVRNAEFVGADDEFTW